MGYPSAFRSLLVFLISCILSACSVLPLDPNYKGPVPRGPEIDAYYSRGNSYSSFNEVVLAEKPNYVQKRITLETAAGQLTIDFFQRQVESTDDLVLVFPLLGGKNHIADHFADYFAEHGFDAAIVHRNNDFKDPANVDKIEELLRENVVRDRIAMDFFERQYNKKDFGSFGISRGGINVAMTAGVDPRLKYNVMAMAGTDLVEIFRKSNQPRLKFYRDSVMSKKNISKEQFFQMLRDNIKTTPENFAQHIDARNTLLMLSVFDRTVPFKAGLKLRQQIGRPKTVLLMADHYTSILYTQYIGLLPPIKKLSFFPMDYVETEALAFYRKSFGSKRITPSLLPIRIFQFPFDLITNIVEAFRPKDF